MQRIYTTYSASTYGQKNFVLGQSCKMVLQFKIFCANISLLKGKKKISRAANSSDEMGYSREEGNDEIYVHYVFNVIPR